jgi:integrase
MISFTTSDIEKYLATRLQEGMAESSVSTEMQYLHPFFAKAHKRGYMARDPFEGMMKFKFCRPRGKRVIFEDAQRFIEAALPEHRLLIDFLYETGMRRTEAAIQLIENIDFERCLVRIINHTPECRCIQCERKRAKKNRLSVRKIFSALKVIGAEERIIPIRPELADRLKSYVSGRTGCVFTMHPESITRICKRLWSKINVTGKAAAHTLRHCFIDDLRRSGADDYIVKVVAGHATNTAIEDLGGSHKNYMHVDILEIQATMKHLWEWRDSQIRVRKVEESGFTIVEPVPGVHQTVHQEVSTDAANASSATT